MRDIQNPILPGFNPDPSIIRVGDDYYIATSTFEWYPGVQIHHSRDLKNWKLVTRPLRRESQLNMLGEANSGGIWAPCLSYDDGTFYLIFTDVKQRAVSNNFMVTTKDILGEWSDPIYLDSRGFDPSLFHDDDGRKWYTVATYDHLSWNYLINVNGRRPDSVAGDRIWEQYKRFDKKPPLFKEILLQEYSEEERRLIGKPVPIFGNEIGSTEAPHIFKRGEYYYLMVAEGGTSYEHCVTLARSKTLEGPYEVHPENPVIRALGTDAYLQKTGHADIVETQNGETYMVFLCSRPLDLKNRSGSIMGRETGIQKMEWGEDGWLRLACGGSVAQKITPAPELPEHKFEPEPVRDNFDSSEPGIQYQWLRGDISKKIFSMTERPGYLRMYGKDMVPSNYIVSLLARRQQAFSYEAMTAVEFNPDDDNQMAGLIVIYSNILNYYIYIGYDRNMGPFISIMSNNNEEINIFEIDPITIDSNKKIYFKAKVHRENLQFYYGYSEVDLVKVGPIFDMTRLSDEHSNGFTGAFVGMCCNDPGAQQIYADFDFFEYIEK